MNFKIVITAEINNLLISTVCFYKIKVSWKRKESDTSVYFSEALEISHIPPTLL